MACIAPAEKFRDYLFKPGATHGKDKVFQALGYSRADSEALAGEYERQAAQKYLDGDFALGRLDTHGQRISIEIEVQGQGAAAGRISYVISGWMIQADGGLRLNTPFSGFSR